MKEDRLKELRPCTDPGIWSDPETRTIAEILDAEQDHKYEVLDRFDTSDLTEEKIKDLADDIAFLLEDELRADIRYHYIDVSMWEGIVMHYIERADFREIAVSWLRSIQKRQQKD